MMMSIFEHITMVAGFLGWSILLHASRIKLPKMRPFNCALCFNAWFALIVYGALFAMGCCRFLDLFTGVGLTAVVVSLTTGFAPWVFRNSDD